jgi:WD40 repeat protein
MAVLADRHIVTSSPDLRQAFRIWPVSTFAKSSDMRAHAGNVQDLQSNGSCLYSIAMDKEIKIWAA